MSLHTCISLSCFKSSLWVTYLDDLALYKQLVGFKEKLIIVDSEWSKREDAHVSIVILRINGECYVFISRSLHQLCVSQASGVAGDCSVNLLVCGALLQACDCWRVL